MKVKPVLGMPQYSGSFGDVVYCYNRLLGTVYTRRKVYPKLTENNAAIGSKSKQIFAIEPSAEYKNDIIMYLVRYNSLRVNHKQPIVNWSGLYIKLMYAMAKADSSIDLLTITREYIYEHELPCISIKDAIKAELLPKVLDWANLDHQI